MTPPVWYLSPYEFVTRWKPQLLSYPLSRDIVGDPAHHVIMTGSGLQKLAERSPLQSANLEPGVDYKVAGGGLDWLAYPDVPSTQHFRHQWIMT